MKTVNALTFTALAVLSVTTMSQTVFASGRTVGAGASSGVVTTEKMAVTKEQKTITEKNMNEMSPAAGSDMSSEEQVNEDKTISKTKMETTKKSYRANSGRTTGAGNSY